MISRRLLENGAVAALDDQAFADKTQARPPRFSIITTTATPRLFVAPRCCAQTRIARVYGLGVWPADLAVGSGAYI